MTLLARGRDPATRRRGGLFAPTAVVAAGVTAIGVAASVYLMQPRWPEPPAAIDTPPLPIVVAGLVFNVPPAAIRMPVQRRSGPQDRIDLAYLWPALVPPDSGAPNAAPRLFVTIEEARIGLSAAERLKSIYPRYTEGPGTAGREGLTTARFRDGSPYQGEDLIYDPIDPDRFLVRCNRGRDALTMAVCLHERQVGEAALTFRFPRDWLADWRAVQHGIDRLIAQWRPNPAG